LKNEVRRIGLGICLDENNLQHRKIKETFRCLEGEELQYIHATVRPTNIASLKMLENLDSRPVERGIKY
jgi:hypothetical protein